MAAASDELYHRQVLCVDSRSREDFANTTPSDYVVKFPVFKNVKMVRLITSEVPNTAYVFDATNNVLDIDLGIVPTPGLPPVANVQSATITPGTYTGAELANEINRTLNVMSNTAFGVTFTATYITFTQKIQIDRPNGGPGANFQILFGTGVNASRSPYLQLGFNQANTTIATSISSDNVVYLVGENYVYLCIKQFAATRVLENIQNVFAKLNFPVPPRSIAFDAFASNEVVFQQPLDIKQLDISIRKRDGSLYEFNTCEHSFTLEFYTSTV